MNWGGAETLREFRYPEIMPCQSIRTVNRDMLTPLRDWSSEQRSRSGCHMKKSKLIRFGPTGLRMSLVILSMIAATCGRVHGFDHVVGGANRSVWKFLDDGTSADERWRLRDFDDSKWRVGAAPLGYGGGAFRTLVEFGDRNSKYITTYFRHDLRCRQCPRLRPCCCCVRTMVRSST